MHWFHGRGCGLGQARCAGGRGGRRGTGAAWSDDVRWAAACELIGMINLIWKFVSCREIWDSHRFSIQAHTHTHMIFEYFMHRQCRNAPPDLFYVCSSDPLTFFHVVFMPPWISVAPKFHRQLPPLWPASPRKMWSLERAAVIILVEQNSARAVQAAAMCVNSPCVSHRSIGRTRFLPKCWLKLMMKMNSVFLGSVSMVKRI